MSGRELHPGRGRTLGTTGTTAFDRSVPGSAILGAVAAIGQTVVAQSTKLALETQAAERVRTEVHTLQMKVAELEHRLSEMAVRSRVVALASLGHDRFRLRGPLQVEMESTGETVSASITELETYGVGDSDPEALDDLRRAIVSDYLFLVDNEARLGPDPKRLLAVFRDLIEELP